MNNMILLVVGLLSGVCASLGIGGGFVLLIYLTAVATTPQLEGQLVNLLFFLPIALISIILHMKNKLIEKSVLLPSIIGGVGGVLIGAYVANVLTNDMIAKTFSVFILLVGLKELFFNKKRVKK